jgi:hypothetical protein
MALFCAPMLTYSNVRFASVLAQHHFLHPLPDFSFER